MKKNRMAILILVLIAITFNSCNQLGIGHNIEANENYNESVTPSIEQIEKPTVEKIQNDLLGYEVDTWSFDKLEEFKNTEIIRSTINYKDSTLEIIADLDLISYSTSELYKGRITITYNLNETTWKFNKVDGDISNTQNETIGNDDNTIGSDKIIYDDSPIGNNDGLSQENAEAHKSNNLIICPNCNGTGVGERICDVCWYNSEGYSNHKGGGYSNDKGRLCGICRGTGKRPAECRVCGGSGRVKEYE